MLATVANDAPALRQAQIGIAVSTATDVAKSAAGVVLTQAGLVGIVAAVKEGRITFQRILTYTLNAIIKKVVTVVFLVLGLIVTGHAILTPMLMVIVMITGDFLSMSLTTDNVRPSQKPNSWNIGGMTVAAVLLGICLLTFCSGVLYFGQFGLHLGTGALQTLAFLVLVFGSQGTIYAIRERRHMWSSRPSLLLAASSVVDISIAATLAIIGVAMAPISPMLVAGTLARSGSSPLLLDLIKIPVFAHLGIVQGAETSDSGTKKRAPTATNEPAARASNPHNAIPVITPTPESASKPLLTPKTPVTAEAAEPEKEDAKREIGDVNVAVARGVPPELVNRVHQFYEDLGREDVRAVQSWDKDHAQLPAEKH